MTLFRRIHDNAQRPDSQQSEAFHVVPRLSEIVQNPEILQLLTLHSIEVCSSHARLRIDPFQLC
jgi:hypothetical protein